MDQRDLLRAQMETAFGEIRQLIYQLATAREDQTRNWLLARLWQQVIHLHGLVGGLDQAAWAPQYAAAHAPAPQPGNLPAISPEQLATYTGRSGMPAYVAVNGTVYDMTNHKGWSTGTHFGLSAGRDLTTQFGSCHFAQPWILGTLVPVGRLP